MRITLRAAAFTAALALVIFSQADFAQETPGAGPPAAPPATAAAGEYRLPDFGPVATAKEAQSTLERAIQVILAEGGGELAIPPGVAPDWVAHNDAPSSTRAGVPSLTLVDRRGGYERRLLPSNGQPAGMVWSSRSIAREVRQPIDMAMGVHSTESIDTHIAGGTSSYLQRTLEAVKAGEDARIDVVTIRGLSAGSQVIVTGAPESYAGPHDRGPIKRLGWDKERRRAYIVMDLEHDHPKGALLYNKHVVNSMTITDHSQSDNQSMGLMVTRKNYGQGDSFTISAHSRSMGNNMSAAGDEGALAYAADIYNDIDPFRSKVERVDWSKCELVYEAGAVRNHTLGTSRPIINLNAKKHIASGRVFIIAPGHADPFSGQVVPQGAVIGSKDCGWTDDVVGRFFAVDEPSEYLDPKDDQAAGYTAAPTMRVHRWYLIQKREARPDGTQRLYVERTFWWSANTSGPNLYDSENYTTSLHQPALRYIIAPGAYVSDVSKSWTDSEHQGGMVPVAAPRTLILAPSSDADTPFDFEKGDPIAQAIGQDPWNGNGVRVRHHNYLPGAIGDSSFQAINHGRVAVHSALSVAGGSTGDLAEDKKLSKDHRPTFRKGIEISASTGTGIEFLGDVDLAAISFEQPHGRAQPIVWRAKGRSASLKVDPESGDMIIQGSPLSVSAVKGIKGLSGTDVAANNLRQINVRVPAGANQMSISFEIPEADSQYAILTSCSWLTLDAVKGKTPEGFTLVFEKPAPEEGGQLDWLLVR